MDLGTSTELMLELNLNMKLSEGRRVDGSPVLLARNPGSLIPINLNLINYKGISCELYMAF